jgi:hypothetical protein
VRVGLQVSQALPDRSFSRIGHRPRQLAIRPDPCSASSGTDEELHRIEPRAEGLLPDEQNELAMVKQPDKRARFGLCSVDGSEGWNCICGMPL